MSAAHDGLTAASSTAGGAGLLALAFALPLALLLHWSPVRLSPERWRPTVFLALPERPG